MSPFKAYVEEMIKRLREALGASLRKKVRLCGFALESPASASTSVQDA